MVAIATRRAALSSTSWTGERTYRNGRRGPSHYREGFQPAHRNGEEQQAPGGYAPGREEGSLGPWRRGRANVTPWQGSRLLEDF